MRLIDLLRLKQLEDTVSAFRSLTQIHKPALGWVRTTREALGMTNGQLAKRMGRAAPQTIEGMQASEVSETIKLKTLRELAEAMNCRLVYALVPIKSFAEIREDQARSVAVRQLKAAAHSMRMENQAVTRVEENAALERQVQKLLTGSPKKLWD
jgi:predicted DNA-binding mobile mystery protein A